MWEFNFEKYKLFCIATNMKASDYNTLRIYKNICEIVKEYE